jgi:glycosyltransferase involved in cell wall biosynthesis
MKISLVIVTRNRDFYLKRLLSSVLNGSRIPDEIIIVDNNSSDHTYQIVNQIIKLDTKVNQLDTKVGQLDKRLEKVEHKLDTVTTDHEHRIQKLEVVR